VAVKGLDTVLLRVDGHEIFGFTTFEASEKLESGAWRLAPATIQAALTDKLDIRVTVVEDQVFAASITVDGYPIAEDWRRRKRDAQFRRFDLPLETTERCRKLVRSLGLRFGAIDLALCDGEYYFLEINPTGEWAWLVDSAGLPIDEAIANALTRKG
jgi:glutathione synthase/RimK-type ligase-like ATP-grasp enzyme